MALKMAKASQNDLNTALALANFIANLEQGYLPEPIATDLNEDCFDIDDSNICQKIVKALLDVTEKGSIWRVIHGMTCVCDPANDLIDPNADTLEIHPRFKAIKSERDQLLEALKNLLASDPNIASATDAELHQASINSIDALVCTQAKNVLAAREIIAQVTQKHTDEVDDNVLTRPSI